VSHLAAKADAAVVGTVTTRFEAKTLVTFDIAVQRVIKGDGVPAVVHVSHHWNGGWIGPAATFEVTVTGIWMLTKTPSGNWDVMPCRQPNNLFVNLSYPASPSVPSGPQAYSSGTPLADSLTFEVAAGLQSQGHSPHDHI
jgi:hypothetical protein